MGEISLLFPGSFCFPSRLTKKQNLFWYSLGFFQIVKTNNPGIVKLIAGKTRGCMFMSHCLQQFLLKEEKLCHE